MRRRAYAVQSLILISLLALAFCLYSRAKIYREEIAIIDDICFGMTPSEVEAAWGKPYEETEVTPLVSGVPYLYQKYRIPFDGVEAVVSVRYISFRNEFRLQFCRVECLDIADSDDFCAAIHDTLANKLAGIDGVQKQGTSSGFSFYVNRGPVGTLYSVTASEQTVTIDCECNEFYR